MSSAADRRDDVEQCRVCQAPAAHSYRGMALCRRHWLAQRR